MQHEVWHDEHGGPEEDGKEEAWNHFCKALELSNAAIKALGEVGVKTPQSWYEHADCTMTYNSTSPLAQKVEKIFEFDNKGQIVLNARSRLMNAWFWLNEHDDALKGDDFCKAFRKDSYAQEIQETKRKLLQLGVSRDEGRERKRPALETKSSRLSASSFTADSKHVLEGVGTLLQHPYKHMIPSHVRNRFLSLLEQDDDETVGESTRIQTIKQFFQDKGDGYKLKSMGETTEARSVQEDIIDGLMKTGVFNKRITTEREYNDGLPIADRARTLKDLDLGDGVTTSGSPLDGYFHTKKISSQELGEREVNLLVPALSNARVQKAVPFVGLGRQLHLPPTPLWPCSRLVFQSMRL
jgi:hypothetical protein